MNIVLTKIVSVPPKEIISKTNYLILSAEISLLSAIIMLLYFLKN